MDVANSMQYTMLAYCQTRICNAMQICTGLLLIQKSSACAMLFQLKHTVPDQMHHVVKYARAGFFQ